MKFVFEFKYLIEIVYKTTKYHCRISPWILPSGPTNLWNLFSIYARIIFTTVFNNISFVAFYNDLIFRFQIVLPFSTFWLKITESDCVIHWEKVLKSHDEHIRIVLVFSLNILSKIIRTCNLLSISMVYIIPICVIMRYDFQQSRVLRLVSEDTHRLNPAMFQWLHCRNNDSICEPIIENIVEKIHAGVHIKASFIVHYFMPHNICHRCHFRKPRKSVDFE